MPKGFKAGGRVAGTPNKATAEIKAMAGKFAPEVIAGLAEIALKGESEQARVAASNALLDRAYGKPAQMISGDADNPIKTILEVAWGASKGNAS